MPICDVCGISTNDIIKINIFSSRQTLCIFCHQQLHSINNKLNKTNTLNSSKKMGIFSNDGSFKEIESIKDTHEESIQKRLEAI